MSADDAAGTADDRSTDATSDPRLGNPVPERGGATVDEAVETAEQGSRVEGGHTPSGQAESGDSRVEHMPDVVDSE